MFTLIFKLHNKNHFNISFNLNSNCKKHNNYASNLFIYNIFLSILCEDFLIIRIKLSKQW
jgi:hypothetical protein